MVPRSSQSEGLRLDQAPYLCPPEQPAFSDYRAILQVAVPEKAVQLAMSYREGSDCILFINEDRQRSQQLQSSPSCQCGGRNDQRAFSSSQSFSLRPGRIDVDVVRFDDVDGLVSPISQGRVKRRHFEC